MYKKNIIVMFLLMGIVSILLASPLEDKLTSFSEVNAKGYLRPFVDSFGAGLNSGHYTSAKTSISFMPSVKIGSSMVMIPNSDKNFYLKDDSGNENVKTPTIFGKNGHGDYPSGANLSMLSVPQATISLGLPMGNEIMLLWLPETKIKKIGTFSLWGVGAKHSIDQYFGKLFPIHLAIQGMYQNVEVADVMKIGAWDINLIASKNLVLFSVYGGIGYEQTSFDVKYSRIGTQQTVEEFTMKADNDIKFTIGAEYNILIIGIYADYTIANTPSINAGVKVGF